MRQRSDLWIKLAARGMFKTETVAVIGGVEYSAISAPEINRALLSNNVSVGNCNASSLKMAVLTDDEIPKAASVVIKSRITNGIDYSEWKEFGTFYIDTRSEENGLLTIQCFDSMLKANQQYADPTNNTDRIGWPKSMKACVEEIAYRIGVEVDPRTKIKTGDAYQVPYPDDLAMVQVLGYIGACHGGNWTITPENKLRLVPLVSPPVETFNVVDYDYNKIYTDDGYKMVWQHTETAETVEHKAGGGIINVPVVTGKITTAKTKVITRVTLAVDEDTGYTAGNDDGYELRIESNPYACQAICDDLYIEMCGIEYVPYTISKACYDPATELGDWVLVGDYVRSVLYSETTVLNVDFRVEASAPGKDEVSSEYPYLTGIKRLQQKNERLQKYVEKVKGEVNSKIEQTERNILLEVSGTYATSESVNSKIEVVEKGISAEVERASGEEDTLLSLIALNESNINLKVSKGDVSSQISVESGDISITSNRIAISSNYLTITKYGTVTASNITASGTLSSKNGSYESKLQSGNLYLYHNDSLTGAIRGNATATGEGGDTYQTLDIEGNQSGIIFTIGNTYYAVINNGLNADGFTERILLHSTVRVRDNMYCCGAIHYENREGVDYGYMGRLEGGGFYFSTNVYTKGDLSCGGTKNRIVETEHYGNLALNAVESTAAVFSDFGSATLDESGVAMVFFDPRFIEVIDTVHEYFVFVTPTNTNNITHVDKDNGFFTVYGAPGATCDWIVYARQKGYEQNYLETFMKDAEPVDTEDQRVAVGDDAASIQSEAYMNEFGDNLDALAQEYLDTYESEVMGYDY